MDLASEAERLRLDLLAVELCAVLADSGVDHVLLKGPSTANWLYDPPRAYRDVDVLVPASRLLAARDAIAAAGLAASNAGLPGEEADHSFLLRSTDGFEVDLHRSLPAVPVDGDAVWDVLATHIEPLDIGVGVVPALDEPARCLVLTLHALGGAAAPAQPSEDLRRAVARAQPDSWTAAARLADQLAIRDLFDAGLSVVAAAPDRSAVHSRRARLYVSGAPRGALALQRLAEARRRDRPRLLAREVVPSRGFMAGYGGGPVAGTGDLLRAHVQRWKALVRELPGAVSAWRAARRR